MDVISRDCPHCDHENDYPKTLILSKIQKCASCGNEIHLGVCDLGDAIGWGCSFLIVVLCPFGLFLFWSLSDRLDWEIIAASSAIGVLISIIIGRMYPVFPIRSKLTIPVPAAESSPGRVPPRLGRAECLAS